MNNLKTGLLLISLSIIGLIVSYELFVVKEIKNFYTFFIGYFSFALTNIGISIVFFSNEEKKRKKNFRILFSIFICLLLLFVFLKQLSLPGGNIVFVSAIFFSVFAIFPIHIKKRFDKWKMETNNKFIAIILSTSDYLGAFLTLQGIMFNSLHWPTAKVQITLGLVFFILAVLGWNWVFRKSIEARKMAESKLNDAYLELEHKHKIIEEKQKEIIDSIKYAKRIQQSLLPTNKYITKQLEQKK